jgi:osmotically-inducible protein OsmY
VGVVARRDLLRHHDCADREISMAVGDAIAAAGLSELVDPEVTGGIVTLTGTVPTDDERLQLEQKVRLIDGVLALDDRLSTVQRVDGVDR